MPRFPMLAAFRGVLKALYVVNFVFAAFVVALIVASIAAPEQFVAALGAPNAAPSILVGLRLLAAIGLLSAPLAYIILTRMIGIVDTVRDGDPFVSENAARLLNMAWALLGLEVLHLFSIAVAVGASNEKDNIDWSFSVTGWLAVLLLFVLARVFEHGARMREDLEGTV